MTSFPNTRVLDTERNRAVGTGGAGPPLHILVDQLTIFQPGGQIMSIILLLAPSRIFRPSYGPVLDTERKSQSQLASSALAVRPPPPRNCRRRANSRCWCRATCVPPPPHSRRAALPPAASELLLSLLHSHHHRILGQGRRKVRKSGWASRS